LLQSKVDFAIETTLTTKSYVNTIEFAKQKGYAVTLLFFWLSDVGLAMERVKARVNEGGHNIPEDTIKRRYTKGIYNLVHFFIPHCDDWFVMDNSGEIFTFISQGFGKNETFIYNNEIWKKIKKVANEL
ncbi:MAG: zeta toxin family protein, partial [Ferruginibacter sp.]